MKAKDFLASIAVEEYDVKDRGDYLLKTKYSSNIDLDAVEPILRDIMSVIKTFHNTVTTLPMDDLVKVTIFIIDQYKMFILLDVDERVLPLYIGRNGNNILVMKRQLSNIAGKYKYLYKLDDVSIYYQIKQLI